MSRKIENMEQLVNKLEEHFEDTEFNTVVDVVDAIVELGNTDKVYAFDDDHLGVKDDLSQKFLEKPIADADKEEFESELEIVLDQAENTLRLAERELTEEQIEDIKEDYISRGLDPDDIDI